MNTNTANIANIVAKLKNLSPEQYVKLASLAFPEIQWIFTKSKKPWNGIDLVDKCNTAEVSYVFQIDFDEMECRMHHFEETRVTPIPLTFQQSTAIVLYLMSLDLPFEQSENNNDAKDVEQIGSLAQQRIRNGIVIHTAKLALDKQHSIFYYGQTIAGYSLDNGNEIYLVNKGALDVIFHMTHERLYGEKAMQKAIELNLTDLDIEGMSEDACFMAENWFEVEIKDGQGNVVKNAEQICTSYDKAMNFFVTVIEANL